MWLPSCLSADSIIMVGPNGSILYQGRLTEYQAEMCGPYQALGQVNGVHEIAQNILWHWQATPTCDNVWFLRPTERACKLQIERLSIKRVELRPS